MSKRLPDSIDGWIDYYEKIYEKQFENYQEIS